MTPPRITTRAILFASSVVAADIALLQLVDGAFERHGLVVGVCGVAPMAHVLAVACFINLCRRATRPFFVGFALLGALAMAAWFNACLALDDGRSIALEEAMTRGLEDARPVKWAASRMISKWAVDLFHAALLITLFIFMTLIPQLLVALIGGYVARRLEGPGAAAGGPGAAGRGA